VTKDDQVSSDVRPELLPITGWAQLRLAAQIWEDGDVDLALSIAQRAITHQRSIVAHQRADVVLQGLIDSVGQ
jgi:hypothetical protein